MNTGYWIIVICTACLLFSCKNNSSKSTVTALNLELSKEIDKMANADQQMQLNMLRFMSGDEEEYMRVEETRDLVYAKNAKRAEEILDQYGYPDENLVGRKSSKNFYTLIMHATEFPDIKAKAIEKFRERLTTEQEQIDAYANMVDQAALEQKKPVVYGNLVQYKSNGQAFVQHLQDSAQVDTRRTAIGLDSLEHYLNYKTLEYYQINRAQLNSNGITQPAFYQ